MIVSSREDETQLVSALVIYEWYRIDGWITYSYRKENFEVTLFRGEILKYEYIYIIQSFDEWSSVHSGVSPGRFANISLAVRSYKVYIFILHILILCRPSYDIALVTSQWIGLPEFKTPF